MVIGERATSGGEAGGRKIFPEEEPGGGQKAGQCKTEKLTEMKNIIVRPRSCEA